jgi:hypothetical protein
VWRRLSSRRLQFLAVLHGTVVAFTRAIRAYQRLVDALTFKSYIGLSAFGLTMGPYRATTIERNRDCQFSIRTQPISQIAPISFCDRHW